MIPKKRMLLALNHKEPDQVPLGELGVDSPITEEALRRKTFYRAKWREWRAIWEDRVWKYSPLSEGWPICIKQREMGLKDLKESSPSKLEPDESELELVRYVVRELGRTHFILGRTGDGSFWRNPFIFGGGGGERTFSLFENQITSFISEPNIHNSRQQVPISTRKLPLSFLARLIISKNNPWITGKLD